MAKSRAKKTPKAGAPTEDLALADPALRPIEELASSEGLTPIFNPQFSFQILGGQNDATADSAIRLMRSLAERRKNRPSNFRTLREVQTSYLPLHHFALQYLFGTIGLPKGTLGTLTAQESTGKTTLLFEVLGAAMRQGCPGVYIETENKPMPYSRARRCLSNNPELSERLAQRMLWTQAFSLREFEEQLINVVDAYRGKLNAKKNDGSNVCVPIDTPIVVACDVWSRLMTDAEAEGFYAYGRSAEKFKNEDYTATGEGSNLVAAKWAHAFARRLPAFLNQYNVILICSNHQTEKIDMSGSSKPMNAESSALYNKTARGGRAFNHLAAWQLTMAAVGQHKVGETVIGKKVTMRMAKQSFGPEGRRITGILRTEMQGDTTAFMESAMDLDMALCDLLIEHGLCGLSVENRRYSSKELQITAGSAHDVAVAFHTRRDVVIAAGRMLRIEGYAEFFPDSIKAVEEESQPKKGLRVQPHLVAESKQAIDEEADS